MAVHKAKARPSDSEVYRKERIEMVRSRLNRAIFQFGQTLGRTMNRFDLLEGVPVDDRGGLLMKEDMEISDKEYDLLVLVMTKIALNHGEFIGYDGSGGESAPSDEEIANALTDGDLTHFGDILAEELDR